MSTNLTYNPQHLFNKLAQPHKKYNSIIQIKNDFINLNGLPQNISSDVDSSRLLEDHPDIKEAVAATKLPQIQIRQNLTSNKNESSPYVLRKSVLQQMNSMNQIIKQNSGNPNHQYNHDRNTSMTYESSTQISSGVFQPLYDHNNIYQFQKYDNEIQKLSKVQMKAINQMQRRYTKLANNNNSLSAEEITSRFKEMYKIYKNSSQEDAEVQIESPKKQSPVNKICKILENNDNFSMTSRVKNLRFQINQNLNASKEKSTLKSAKQVNDRHSIIIKDEAKQVNQQITQQLYDIIQNKEYLKSIVQKEKKKISNIQMKDQIIYDSNQHQSNQFESSNCIQSNSSINQLSQNKRSSMQINGNESSMRVREFQKVIKNAYQNYYKKAKVDSRETPFTNESLRRKLSQNMSDAKLSKNQINDQNNKKHKHKNDPNSYGELFIESQSFHVKKEMRNSKQLYNLSQSKETSTSSFRNFDNIYDIQQLNQDRSQIISGQQHISKGKNESVLKYLKLHQIEDQT
ncbi:UNKNOWN [Stylonychia lemnae]|uniref:Uncharacterized protein n=1 Tax=Stylonychia lemnae TaxID=5949 RepID=A0A078AVX1_STYLE|nr:UNKNOWN [Stylonychia lemnae]|eukprot:CDW84923.1 UNKNOWN [Stylonychia lemnae]